MHEPTFLVDLALVLGVGAVTSVVARLLHQPSILGYLAAGLIVGPYIPLPFFADPERIQAMAEFGVVLVMFALGLEFRVAKLVRVLPVAGLTALLQMSALIWAGFSLGRVLGWSVVESSFLGASIAISSTMVVSRVFDQQPVGRDVREMVLGVLILQDVGAIALIALMTAVATGGTMDPNDLVATLGWLFVALAGMLGVGMLIVPRAIRAVAKLKSGEILTVFSIGLCFVLAVLAERLGYSVALGSFLAGILVAESGHSPAVEKSVQSVRDMFAAIFFVSIGMTVDPGQAMESLPAALLVFLVVVVGQFAAVSVAGILSGNGLRRSITAGLALGQIGEFAFILGAIGVSAGVVEVALQPILVTVAIGTAFTTPLLLAAAPRWVQAVDRLLPHRAQWLLGMYESWLGRMRRALDNPRSSRKVGRALRAIAFDAVALDIVFALTAALYDSGGVWFASRLSTSAAGGHIAVIVLAVIVAAPLVAGLVRNANALSKLAGESLLSSAKGGAAVATRIASHTLRALILLSVLLGVVLPSIAVLRPIYGGPYVALGLCLLVAAVGVYLWRNAGAMAS
ncbi:MAG TPA: cation:proton antiporter [Vicinamibacteria bacterium]|nr:cation:proton antiporter [Vicinamibacteria bacterium]